ncbi:MAG: class I SAM-dependent methyltransferase [Pseudomonadota bacterium]
MSLVLARHPARVVDAGCGSGRFTVALRRAGFDGPLLAVDADPRACAMTRAHLAAAGLAPAEVCQADFLTTRLERTQGRTAFVGNPPYVRHHLLSPATKRWAQRCARDLGVKLSGLAGLHVLFLLAMARASQGGDLGCLVTSAEWLDARYGAAPRHLLAGRLGLTSLDVFDARADIFAGTASTAAVFAWEVGWGGGARVGRPEALEGPVARGIEVGREGLATAPRWSVLGRDRGPDTGGLVPLSSYARVHRGLATGANAFFTMTAREAEARGLTPWVRPCLCHAREVGEGSVSPSSARRVLVCPPDGAAEEPAVRAWIGRGLRAGVSHGYLCRMRRRWWDLGTPPAPPIVATYMARRPPRFALNPEGCAVLNVIHGIWFKELVEPAVAAALVDWLNAHAGLLEGARTYHGGLRKWEPSDLEAVLVPPLAALRELAAASSAP